jgi:hypothetical protein
VRRRGQSLIELAVALPALLILALGSAALLRLADAKAGLDGATAAAVADAARQPFGFMADTSAQTRFQEIVVGYPVLYPVLSVSGGFARGSYYSGSASAYVDLGFVPLWFLPRRVRITSSARSLVEPWRSRSVQPYPGPSP